jgi:hypothetical protein
MECRLVGHRSGTHRDCNLIHEYSFFIGDQSAFMGPNLAKIQAVYPFQRRNWARQAHQLSTGRQRGKQNAGPDLFGNEY